MVLRVRKRIVAALASFLIVVVYLSAPHRSNIASRSWSFVPRRDVHVPGGFPYVKPSSPRWNTPFPTTTTANWNATRTAPPSLPGESSKADRDRILVIASLEREDVSWISRSFPDWQTALYSIPSSFAQLHQAADVVDKGRIASAYLTYIIKNYYNLPSTVVFLTPHRNTAAYSKKNRDPHYTSLGRYALLNTLNLAHVQKTGYLNLRCQSKSACLTTILPFRSPPSEYRTLEVAMPKAWAALFNSTMPEKLTAPCCAEFAVSREQVRKRSVHEYTRIWEWLNIVKMDDDTAGLVMEALWHVVFGRDAVDCEEDVGVRECECDVYGNC